MPRLTPITEADLDDAQRAVLEAIQQGPRGAGMGLTGPFGVYVRSPGVGDAAQNLGAAVRYRTELPENVKEVAICTVGAFYRARYEFAAHAALAAKAGVDATVIEALRTGATPEFADQREAVAHAVAGALLASHTVDDALYARGLEVLGETGMVELVMTVGYYCLVSLTLNAFRIPLREGMQDPFPEAD